MTDAAPLMQEFNLESIPNKRRRLLVWDAEGIPPVGDWITVLWSSFGEVGDTSVVSMPKLVEEQADTLRSRYLFWIYELGETRINDKRLVDQLELRPGFSYWWMTLLVEKSYGKSTRLHDVVKFFALEDLAGESDLRRITLVCSDQTLAATFQNWCRTTGVDFEWKQSRQSGRQISLIRRLCQSMPYPVQAVFSLVRYLWHRWPLKRIQKELDTSAAAETTFVDYLFNLKHSTLTTGRFASNYWTELIGAFEQAKTRVNWLHLYEKNEIVQTTKQARDLIARFNHNGAGLEYHAILDGAPNFPVVLAVLHDYVRLTWRSLRLGKIRRHFRPAGSNLDLWPLFKRDWLHSMRGPTTIWNCLCLNLFMRTLRRLPCQKLGVYLQENQGWEMAFIYTWRAAGHGHLVGVPHATVRYWDFRYFYDLKSYVRTGKNDLPLPDKVALNGPAALSAYRKGGYPKDQMMEVEALRYLYLADLPPIKPGANEPLTGPLHVLVLGDYLPAVTRRQMQLLTDAAPLLSPDTHYVVKPHPNCPVKTSDYPSLQLHMTRKTLPELLAECDVAYTSNITSAAVDAYSAGVPVVSVMDGNAFNMSPLRGMSVVVFVTNPIELADALRNVRRLEKVAAKPYFCLDKGLTRWRTLLRFNQADAEQSVGT